MTTSRCVTDEQSSCTTASEHVGLIEQEIGYLKDKVRGTTSECSFMRTPILASIQTVYSCAFWINAFLNHSENFGFSPQKMVTGLSTDYERD